MRYLATFCALVLMVISSGILNAAELKIQSGGMYGYSKLIGTDIDGLHEIENYDTQWPMMDIYAEYISSFSSLLTRTSSSFFSFNDCGENMSDFHISASANCMAYSENSEFEMTNTMSTINNNGELFKLTVAANADGEKVGDPVTISFEWDPYIDISADDVTASIKGINQADYLGIAVNPTVTNGDMPTRDTLVWSHDSIVTSDNLSEMITGEFEAHIGDTIIVFIELTVDMNYNSMNFESMQCSSPFYFTVDIETNPADINNDGIVNMEDFLILSSQWMWQR